MKQSFVIGNRSIGPDEYPYVVAEMSANHLGSLERALRIIEVAKRAGADAVKLQTYTADTITIDHDGPGFRIKGGLWDGRTLHDLYRGAATPYEWHEALFHKARDLGITLFSSPFDPAAVDFLEKLGCPVYKIASFEMVDLPLIRYAAATGKPLIISTGMASLEEIGEAVEAARSGGCRELALLHCVSGYPTPADEINLRTIPDLARRFGVVTGLSDHTRSRTVSVAAVAVGATLLEKHVTLSRQEDGPDSQFSVEPSELEETINDCRVAYQALGSATYERVPSERANAVFRRSLYVVENMNAGDIITSRNIRSIRPGLGLPPKYLGDVIGRAIARSVPRGTPLSWDLIADS
ncbi:MAG: pseudaminic acid synthase [Gammaproteobacteria bacterium]